MSTVVNKLTGKETVVPDEAASQMVADGEYTLKGGTTTNVVGPTGGVAAVDAPGLARDTRLHGEAAGQEAQNAQQARFDIEHDTLGSKAAALVGGYAHWLNEAIPGTTSRNWLADKLGIGNPASSDMEAHPWVAAAPEIADTVGGLFVGAGEAKAAAKLAQDPAALERAASLLSSKAVFAGEHGAGELAKGAEVGLGKAGALLKEERAGQEALAKMPDLATLDVKGLNAARDAELESIKAGKAAAEGEAKAAHEALKAPLADEVKSFRTDVNEQKLWLTTKGSEESEIRGIGARAFKADKSLRTILDNPKELARDPRKALGALERQEAAYEELLTKHSDDLRATFAADTTGERAAKLDAIPAMLERNRAIQAKIAEIHPSVLSEQLAAIRSAPAASERLTAIESAKDALMAGAAKKSGLGERMLEGAIYGKTNLALGALGMAIGGPLGGVVGMAAPMISARAGKYITERVFGRLAKGATQQVERQGSAVARFMASPIGKGASIAAPVLATKVLANVAYGPSESKATKPTDLAGLYNARASELRAATVDGPTGPVMTQAARAQIAATLQPIAALHPLMADRLETIQARRIEFLASKLPRRPDLAGMGLMPDKWQPSDMQMRTFARYAAAVEDPHAVIERLAHGTITTEDTEAMKTVYPELHAQVVQQIVEQLGTLTKPLPYQRRLSLSIFTGQPLDPSMDPRVIASLQSNYAAESQGQGGPPMPKPAFGSVRSAEKATPAQQRAAGETAV